MQSAGEWRERGFDPAAAEGLRAVLPPDVPPRLAETLAARGVTAESLADYLEPSLDPLRLDAPDGPDALDGIREAVEVILPFVADRRKIVVFGDYDADGVCATAILVRTLAKLGADASGFIPRREGEGYGLTAASIARLFTEHPQTALLVTVDNGVNAVREVAEIRSRGVKVVVTDHHLPGEELPQADALVDPKVAAPAALADLCGAGVALLLAARLADEARRRGCYGGAKLGGPLLVLAGIATVTDVMPLTGVNRSLVRWALRHFARHAPEGLRALFLDEGKHTMDRINARDFGFLLGPRLNAAGRMANADDALELVSTDDCESARQLALKVKGYNALRRGIEERMSAEAVPQLVAGAPAQVVCDAGLSTPWHSGVSGIVASRLLERANVPVAVVAGLHGSARAPDGYNVRDALAECGSLLERFGGHAGAAGFTVRETPDGRLDEFRAAFAAACARQHGASPSAPSARSFDGWLKGGEITLAFCEAVARMEPFGEGNAEPVFALGQVFIRDARPMGDTGRHLSLQFKDAGIPRAVWWNHGADVEMIRANGASRFDVFFKVKVSEHGDLHPELVVEDLFPSR